MTPATLDWLVHDFVERTPGIVHTVVVSADGLRLATSTGVDDALGDQLSAATSGLVSLARGTAALLHAGPVTQTILEMHGGYLFVTAVADGATLAVVAGRQCDIGMVGYEMTMLGDRVGHALRPGVRAGTAP